MKPNSIKVVSASASGFALAAVSTASEHDQRLLGATTADLPLSAYPDEDDDAIAKDDDEE